MVWLRIPGFVATNKAGDVKSLMFVAEGTSRWTYPVFSQTYKCVKCLKTVRKHRVGTDGGLT